MFEYFVSMVTFVLMMAEVEDDKPWPGVDQSLHVPQLVCSWQLELDVLYARYFKRVGTIVNLQQDSRAFNFSLYLEEPEHWKDRTLATAFEGLS